MLLRWSSEPTHKEVHNVGFSGCLKMQKPQSLRAANHNAHTASSTAAKNIKLHTGSDTPNTRLISPQKPDPRISGSYQSNSGQPRSLNDHGAPQSGCSAKGSDCRWMCSAATHAPKAAGMLMIAAAAVLPARRLNGNSRHSSDTSATANKASRCSMHFTHGFMCSTYCPNSDAPAPASDTSSTAHTIR